MSARRPDEVRPISLTWLAGISLATFVVVFLVLEVVVRGLILRCYSA